MATFSQYGGALGAPYQGGLSASMSFRPQGGIGFDADPITPGNQATPGIVTATGPSRVVSGGIGTIGGVQGGVIGGLPGGVSIPSISTNPQFGQRIGFGGIAAGGVIDADPITPGIQSQPGVVTPIGPPRVVSGPGAIGGRRPSGGIIGGGIMQSGVVGIGGTQRGLFGGVQGGIVDADPITPGIQSQPGVVTPMGPPRIVSGSTAGFGTQGVGYGASFGSSYGGINNNTFATRTVTTGGQIGSLISGGAPSVITGGSAVAGSAIGGIIDHDPITPGIQSQPGIVTPMGPPRVISGPTAIGGINTTITSGIAGSFGGVVDADPITPGIQSQPGIVTQTGPTTVISSGFRGSGAILTSGYQGNISTGIAGGMLSSGVISGPTPMLSSGVQQNIIGGGLFDADPITPGIQLQPGTVTVTGPTTMLSSGGFGSSNFPTGIVDADPFTPGIQSQPGVITQTGPTTVISGGNVLGSIAGGLQQSIGGVYDADPFTPGIQSQPGVITTTGPSVVVGYSNQGWWTACLNNQCCPCPGGCPWWLWPLLGLLLLGTLIGGLYSCFKPSQSSNQQDKQERNVKTECLGYIDSKGNCIACPQGSKWNGKTCTYTTYPLTVSEKTTITAEQGQTPSGTQLPSSITSVSQNSGSSSNISSANRKVAVFGEQQGQQAISGVLKGATLQGFAPTVVTSKPTPSTPSSIIDASNGTSDSAESVYTSTNVVTVPAVTQKRSIAPTITYSTGSVCLTPCNSQGRRPYISKFSRNSLSSLAGASSSSSSSTQTTTSTVTSEVSPVSSEPTLKHLHRLI